jgi:ubiquinone biosynthesis protein
MSRAHGSDDLSRAARVISCQERLTLGPRAAARAAAVAGSAIAGAGGVGLARMGMSDARERQRRAGERLARRLDRLGGAYLKAGQLLSTRADLLPEALRSSLMRLCDDATPAPIEDCERWLYDALGSDAHARLIDLDPRPIATGSVAHVHRARRADTGASVVVKILRPNVEAQFGADLMLMRAGAGLVARLPVFRSVPVTDATRSLTAAVAAHLDLAAEAEQHARFAAQFADVEGVVIPRLQHDLCTRRALVMDYVEADRIDDPGLDQGLVENAVLRVLRCLYAMLFDHGLVHCDLHPGNVLITEAADIVLLDFGYVAHLRRSQQDAFAKLFVSMALDDADGITEVIVDTARSVPARLDRVTLKSELGAHVTRTTGATAEEFSIARFVAGLFAIQHRHRIIASPDFAMSILALMTLEGLIKQITPQLDFQREALPFVLKRAEAVV